MRIIKLIETMNIEYVIMVVVGVPGRIERDTV